METKKEEVKKTDSSPEVKEEAKKPEAVSEAISAAKQSANKAANLTEAKRTLIIIQFIEPTSNNNEAVDNQKMKKSKVCLIFKI